MGEVEFDSRSREEEERLINDDPSDLYPKYLRRPAPVDRFYIVYVIFFILGTGSLLPWNFFSNAKQYFLYKLRNTNISGSESWTNASYYSSDQVMFESYLALAAQIPNVIFVFINMVLTKTISARVRIISSICLTLALFTMTVCLTKVNTDNWQHQFLIVSLITVVLMNAGSATLQGAICGLASMFPKMYVQSMFSGMAFGGLMASLASVGSVGIGSSPVESGFVFFLIGEFIQFLCLVGYLVMLRTSFAKFYTCNASSINAPEFLVNEESANGVISTSILPVEDDSNTCTTILRVARKIWIPGLSIVSVFLVTLACYPAIISAVESYSADTVWANKYFTPVICFVIFNLTDFIGRNVAGLIQRPRESGPVFFIVCLLRALFIPLFLLCNIQPRHHTFIFFKSDAAPIVLSCVFGLSNGYLGTIAMMHAPKLVPEGDVEMAGSMMAFFLTLGLGLGALLSIGLIDFI